VILTETRLDGAFTVDVAPRADARGFFARTLDVRVFAEHGLDFRVAQANVAFNPRRGTLRGMHLQLPPAAEAKLVRCVRGAIHDVIVDLRPDSPTYLEHVGVELTADNRRALYVPPLFAHGYQTLTDDAEVEYQVSEFYAPGHERGLRHDDPRIGIAWPERVTLISDKDAAWPLLGAAGAAPAAAGAP
jgi:dTDP-4-dehydrorhamnose 3,5-epimerase